MCAFRLTGEIRRELLLFNTCNNVPRNILEHLQRTVRKSTQEKSPRNFRQNIPKTFQDKVENYSWIDAGSTAPRPKKKKSKCPHERSERERSAEDASSTEPRPNLNKNKKNDDIQTLKNASRDLFIPRHFRKFCVISHKTYMKRTPLPAAP